jgi:hypothetical protein
MAHLYVLDFKEGKIFMKAAIAILLLFIGGFLLYEVLVGNAGTILTSLQSRAGNGGVDFSQGKQQNSNYGGGAGGTY